MSRDREDVAVQAFRQLLLTAQRMRTAMDARLRREGFTVQQAYVFTAVGAHGGEPRLTELAAAIGMTHQNLRQIVGALERKGMLAVEPDPEDARARRVRVTEAGEEHWRERPRTGHDEVLEWFADLDESELRLLLDVLTRVGARAG